MRPLLCSSISRRSGGFRAREVVRGVASREPYVRGGMSKQMGVGKKYRGSSVSTRVC